MAKTDSAAKPAAQAKPAAASAAKKGVMMYHPERDTHVALTTGHTLVIPNASDGTLVERKFMREALARGALPVGVAPDADDPNRNAFNRANEIRKALIQMTESDEPDAFTTSGEPELGRVAKIVGFQITRKEVNDVFQTMQREASDDDDNPETIG